MTNCSVSFVRKIRARDKLESSLQDLADMKVCADGQRTLHHAPQKTTDSR